MTVSVVSLPSGISFSNDRPFVLIGGMNVIESEELLLAVAEDFVRVTRELLEISLTAVVIDDGEPRLARQLKRRE